jgi:hypothetical protein
MDVKFERVALIGLGLIGASLSHVMRRESLARHIAGHAKTEATRNRAMELGLCHSMHDTAAAAAAGADLVVLCVPVSACGPIAKEIGPAHWRRAPSLPTSVRSSRRSFAMSRPISPTASTSCPATRSPARSIPGRMPDSPICSTTAGAF